MHVDRFVIGKGHFMLTEYVPTRERSGPRFPLILTTGRILSQYNVGAQTRRTDNAFWHKEDVLEIHPFDAEQRGMVDGDLVSLVSRAGEMCRCGRRISERMQPGVVYTTFHYPGSGRQCRDHRQFGLGDQLPGIQGDGGGGAALQRAVGLAGTQRRGRRRPCGKFWRPRPMPPNDSAAILLPPAVSRRPRRSTRPMASPSVAARGRGGNPGELRLRRRALCGDDGEPRRRGGFRLSVSA